jgi:hypothetical protein
MRLVNLIVFAKSNQEAIYISHGFSGSSMAQSIIQKSNLVNKQNGHALLFVTTKKKRDIKVEMKE